MEAIPQSPAANTLATNRILVTIAERGASDCYDEALFRGIIKRLTFSLQEADLDGPIVMQIAPPSDKSAIWIPTDSSAGYAPFVNHIWNGAAWVPVVSNVAINGDTNNAIFLDPAGLIKVNLPDRLRKEVLCTGPAPTVSVSWSPGEYSLGDEMPIIGFVLVSAAPTNAVSALETARTSTSWTGTILGLLAAEQVTLVLDFRQPQTKGD